MCNTHKCMWVCIFRRWLVEKIRWWLGEKPSGVGFYEIHGERIIFNELIKGRVIKRVTSRQRCELVSPFLCSSIVPIASQPHISWYWILSCPQTNQSCSPLGLHTHYGLSLGHLLSYEGWISCPGCLCHSPPVNFLAGLGPSHWTATSPGTNLPEWLSSCAKILLFPCLNM